MYNHLQVSGVSEFAYFGRRYILAHPVPILSWSHLDAGNRLAPTWHFSCPTYGIEGIADSPSMAWLYLCKQFDDLWRTFLESDADDEGSALTRGMLNADVVRCEEWVKGKDGAEAYNVYPREP